VQLSQRPGIQVQAVAEALAIEPFMLSRWRKEAREGQWRGTPAPAPSAGQVMPATFYLLSSLECVEWEELKHAREVATEIAALGRQGMDLNDPERRYRLSTSPGKEFSDLHLVSLLYVCLKALDPTIDPGIDLHGPYLRALQLHQGRRKPES
jgi:transposase-like protein